MEVNIFDDGVIREFTHPHFGKGIHIEIESSIEMPTLTFEMLEELSVLYGTKTISLDNDVIDVTGCPTCGPDYEYTAHIYIYRITQNHPFKF